VYRVDAVGQSSPAVPCLSHRQSDDFEATVARSLGAGSLFFGLRGKFIGGFGWTRPRQVTLSFGDHLGTTARQSSTPRSPLWATYMSAALLILVCVGCQRQGPTETPSPTSRSTQSAKTSSEAADSFSSVTRTNTIPPKIQAACGGCHATPRPERFTDRTWTRAIPFMYWLFQRFYPQPPTYITQDEVLSYYRENAAKRLNPPRLYPESPPGTPRFRLAPFLRSRAPTLIASITALQEKSALLIVDMLAGRIEQVSPLKLNGPPTLVAKAQHPTRAIPFDLDGDKTTDYLVLELSTFGAKDIDRGRVIALLRRGQEWVTQPLVTGAGRIADAAIGDVDGDGLSDIIVADFGWQKTGGLRLLNKRQLTGGTLKYTDTHLDRMAGHIAVVLVDMDGDGDLDLVNGVAQHHERIDLWTNDGRGHFSRRTLFKGESPMWGLIGLRVVDIDGDGDSDILHYNGDTLDAPKVAQFQGVHLLRNDGSGKLRLSNWLNCRAFTA